MKQEIIDLLKKVIKDNYNFELEDIKLENPPKKELWDYAFGCFLLARNLKKSPAQIAGDIMELIKWEDLIESSSVAGPYLNIKVNKSNFTKKFLKYINSNLKIQKNEKTIYIDYIWANVWKPMHIGHMCTPNQGQVMINCYKKLWYNVVSDSHIWDWWIIFGKLILAFKKWWDENKLKENAVEHLLELYIKITAEAEKDKSLEETIRNEFKLLSEWNKESIKLWESFTKKSIEDMNVQLLRMNIQPDFNIWESFYEGLNLPKMENYPNLEFSMKNIVDELKEKGIATETQNDDWTKSVWVHFPEESKISSCILQKRDWTHWYLASDLASIKYRTNNWNLEKIIYFVDSRQQLHLRQAFEIAKKANWLSTHSVSPKVWEVEQNQKEVELFHAYNGFIALKDWAMSTRKGRIIKLDSLLDEAESRAKKIILEKRDDIQAEDLKELSKKIWIWAIKYGYLKKNRESDIIFDWDEFMSFEGNSWPYIQYAYVRAIRILEKENYNQENKIENSSFESSSEIELAKKIMDFRNILKESTTGNYPHIITWYAYDLTKSFSNFYNNVIVKDEKNEDYKKLKLALVNSFSKTLKETFEVLWIEMPEKM
jgi:arginyl-tRNA synthetase